MKRRCGGRHALGLETIDCACRGDERSKWSLAGGQNAHRGGGEIQSTLNKANTTTILYNVLAFCLFFFA